jgi:hypothetical protein
MKKQENRDIIVKMRISAKDECQRDLVTSKASRQDRQTIGMQSRIKINHDPNQHGKA